MEKDKNKKRYRHPLRRRVLFGCAIFSTFVCLLLGFFGGVIYYRGMIGQYENYMEGILRYTLAGIDGDDLEACMASGEKSGHFQETQRVLNQIKENYEIEYIYIVKPLNTDARDNMVNVMAGTTDYEVQYEKDTLVSFGELTGDTYSPEVAAHYLERMSGEDESVTYFANETEFGHDYTGLVPVTNSKGEHIAVLAVDISIEEIRSVLTRYVVIILTALLVLLVLLLTGLYRWMNQRIIRPVSRIQISAERFVESSHGKKDPDSIWFDDPGIHSEDEMQALSESLITMASDLKIYMKDLMRETKEKEQIGAELSVATQIQSSMLPCIFPAFPDRDELDIYATMDPAKEVGGDFYDYFMVDERHLAIVMADVSGKGVPAALFMVIGKTLIKDHTQPGRNLGEIFAEVNKILCESNDNGMFITAFEGVLDLVTGEFRYANAGHEMPFIYRKESGSYEPYKVRPGFVLAGMENIQYREQSITLNPGDRIFLYTDGVTEAINSENELYGMERLRCILNTDCMTLDPKGTLEQVKADIEVFTGDMPQFDDITMLCLEYQKPMGGGMPMKEITLDAVPENIGRATAFVEEILSEAGCPVKTQMQVNIAIDELFGNICHYAYGDKAGQAAVRVELREDPRGVCITFVDEGIPYDPLQKEDPDISLSAEEREIGGLGIYMVKKNMDHMEYRYENGKNILTIRKNY